MSSTRNYYQDHRDVRGDGRIILYRRADTAGQNWSVRLKIPGHTGYVVKSAKTSDDFEARRFAEELYFRLEGRAYRGEAIRSPTFTQVFEEWKAAKRLEPAVGSSRYIPENIRRMEIWAVPYLGHQLISAIDDKAIAQYIDWRIKTAKKPPVIATLRNERTVLNQVFQYAKAKGYRLDVQPIRLPRSRQISRPDIPETEWTILSSFLPKYVQEAQDKRRHRERFYLHLYILILGNSGIRIGEARWLCWRDISEIKTSEGDNRTVLRAEGKTGERDVVCNRGVDQYIDQLRKFRRNEVGTIRPDEPIFCHPDGRPVGSYKKGFETVLDEAGILFGPEDKRRVPYSLRHTYATMRLGRRSAQLQSMDFIHFWLQRREPVKYREGDQAPMEPRDAGLACPLLRGTS